MDIKPTNPFRSKMTRKVFEEAIRSYNANVGGIRGPGGIRRGNSASTEFYRGFDSASLLAAGSRYAGCPYKTAADRQSLGYVYWRAGAAVRYELDLNTGA